MAGNLAVSWTERIIVTFKSIPDSPCWPTSVRQRAAPDRRRRPVNVSLPNGMIVSCLQKHEVPLVRLEIESYFSNGIEVRPGDTIFDVGANIGLFSLAAYERCAQNLRVFAFEPVGAIFELLCVNVERNTSMGQIETLGFGLSSSPETVPFAYYPGAPVLSTAYPDEEADIRTIKESILDSIMYLDEAPLALRWLSWVPEFVRSSILDFALQRTLRGEAIRCRMQTLSRFVRQREIERIDFLKVDVEKAELDVLRGIENDDWCKIRQAVIEVHDVEDRLNTVTELLWSHGLDEITVEQPLTNLNSNIFTVFATRRQ
ncbi:MAG: FkbM family methyltransferase [Rhodospirillales bacterium]|nr:FkbM family methyltransferase [Rhodospirillales bacterium]MDH3790667.1 FkbM family methyltransferase [Rhodospirillales bacterium]MDH3913485.1 FkbM family methyltransferase [Rhodospirillales bacterium]MDH3919757.1 FkbM family methyltransferase [Rhodospirillales bacterium]